MITNGNLFWKSVKLVPSVFLLLVLSALAADTQAPATVQSPQVRSDLIRELEAAKKTDWELALDPTVSPVRQETFLNHMNKADRAIKELSHGFTVSQSELDEALLDSSETHHSGGKGLSDRAVEASTPAGRP